MNTVIIVGSLVGVGLSLTPAAYHAGIKECEERASILSRKYRFIDNCTEDAENNGVTRYLSVRNPDYIGTVCKNRVLLDLLALNPVPGTVSQDRLSRLFASGILDPDCRYVIVSPVGRRAAARREAKRPSSIVAADDSGSVDGEFVSNALAGLAAIHNKAFVIRCTGDLREFEEGGLLRLDPVYVDPLYLASGERDDRAVMRVKYDLETFQSGILQVFAFTSVVRDFGNWVRKIRIDSGQIPPIAEYRVWIDRFAQTMADRKRKEPEPSPEPPVPRDIPTIHEFEREMHACMTSRSSLGWDKCIQSNEKIMIESVGELTLGECKESDGGHFWTTNDPNIILKVSGSFHNFCKERSLLSVLNGLSGRIPSLYTVVDPKCHMMVMGKLGTRDWPGPLDPERPSKHHMADLIEALRDLHDAGFIHNDLYPKNARIDNEHAYLIDFEMTTLVPEHSAAYAASRRSDMKRLIEYIFTLNCDGCFEMFAEMDVLGDDDRPNYEKWIAFYRS